MKTFLVLTLTLTLSCFAQATGHRGSTKSSHNSLGPGTGSKQSSTSVHSYTTKRGRYVEGHHRSTPDTKFQNNWSTKPNSNPYTGKTGTRVTSPKAGGW